MNIIIVFAFASAGLLLSAQAANAQEPITMEAMSDQGTFRVEITWTPADLGRDNTFAIRFIEPDTNTEMEDIKYNILLFRGDDSMQQLRRVDQISTEQKFRFDVPGTYRVMIDDIEGLGESATIPIEVTPEFPAAVVALAVAVGAVVVAARRNSNNLFRLQTNQLQ